MLEQLSDFNLNETYVVNNLKSTHQRRLSGRQRLLDARNNELGGSSQLGHHVSIDSSQIRLDVRARYRSWYLQGNCQTDLHLSDCAETF